MVHTKRILSGIAALAMVCSFAACGDSGEGEVTTTQLTVEKNTETLSPENAAAIDDVAASIEGELENSTIKWLCFFDPFNPNEYGSTKALSLEIFESKYDGVIEYMPTTWANYSTKLAESILGGDGVDFTYNSDLTIFPVGVSTKQIVPFDEYIDWSNPLWAEQKALNDQFLLNGKHYNICLQPTAGRLVIYNQNTIDTLGLDDPWELFENGEWTWDSFKRLLVEFVDDEAGQYGLDGWFNEQNIMLTCGVPIIEMKDGRLSHNLNDPNIERVMNFMGELNTAGVVIDKGDPRWNWNTHIEYIGEGRELFYIDLMSSTDSSPDVWTAQYGDPEDVRFVPMPKDPDADKYYVPSGIEAYVLCKGGQNPEGVMRFMECILTANKDERTQQMTDEKRIKDYGWTELMIERSHKIDEICRENPVYDLCSGVQKDLVDIIGSGDKGIRAAFLNGANWAVTREENIGQIETYVNELNAEIDAAQ